MQVMQSDAERCCGSLQLLMIMFMLLLCVHPASQAAGVGAGEGVSRNDSLVTKGEPMSTAAASAADLDDDDEEDATQVLPASSSTTPSPPVHHPTAVSTQGPTELPTTSTLSSTEATNKTEVTNVLTWSAKDKLQPSNGGATGPQMMNTATHEVKKVEQHQSKNKSVSEANSAHPTDKSNSPKQEDSAATVREDLQTMTPTSVQMINLTLQSSSPSTRHSTHIPSTTTHASNEHHTVGTVSLSPPEHLPPSFHNDHELHPHHSSKPDHVENVRGPGPYFRPPGAISRQHHHHPGDNAWEVDPNCWPRCENVTSPEGQRRTRKHSSFKEKKFYNYKLLYDTLKHQGGIKRQETEYYAWIFGATMLTLGSLTTLTSCVLFCVCGDKLKKRRQKRKPKDKCGQYYQRVDSVSSMVDSHIDPQDYIDQLDSVTII